MSLCPSVSLSRVSYCLMHLVAPGLWCGVGVGCGVRVRGAGGTGLLVWILSSGASLHRTAYGLTQLLYIAALLGAPTATTENTSH